MGMIFITLSDAALFMFSIKALLRYTFFRHFTHFRQIREVCLSESKPSSESGALPRRAVSLWSDDHDDSLKYLCHTYDEKVNMPHYVCCVVWF